MKSLLISIFWRDLIIRYFTFLSLLLHLMLWLLIIIKLLPMVEEGSFLSLHYNIFFGIDLIGPWYNIFLIPVLSLIFLIINCLLLVLLYGREKFLSYFLAAANVLLSIGLLTALVLIVLLNI